MFNMIPRYIVIRDDDISYFTRLDDFKKVHRLLLDEGIPFNAAVVPKVSDNVGDGEGGYEGFIPKQVLGKGRSYLVYENEELIAFIRSLDSIEIAQHGFSHEHLRPGVSEFADSNSARISRKLDEGKDILFKAFGVKPGFFVPPYDVVTKEVLREIRKRFDGISLSQTSHGIHSMTMWGKFLWTKWRGRCIIRWKGFRIVQHPGLDFSCMDESMLGQETVEDIMSKVRDVLVLPLHSWRFFSREGRLRVEALNRWEEFLKRLISDNKIKFLKLSEIKEIY